MINHIINQTFRLRSKVDYHNKFTTIFTGKIDEYLSIQNDVTDHLTKYTYVELDLYTESFDDTPLRDGGSFLGEGGFGKVYLGK